MGRGASDGDRLVFLDGDCCPSHGWAERHSTLLQHAALSIGFRIDLTREQTDGFDEAAVREARPPAPIEPAQLAGLGVRQRRYERSLLLRRLGIPFLVKPHKPKVLSANFGVTLGTYLAINGFDEEYLGYGQEDDDFTRRAYGSGSSAAVAVESAVVYHQWHETRAPGRWQDAPNIPRFNGHWAVRCARGIENPLDQPTPIVDWFERGRAERGPPLA